MRDLKLILGTIAVIGIIMQGVALYYDPDVLLLESSKSYPKFLSWLQWIITLIAVIGFLCIDYKEHSKNKGHNKPAEGGSKSWDVKMQIQRQSRWTVDMIYAIIVGLVLGYSDVPFVLAVLLGLGLVLSKGVSEIFLKTDFIMKTPSPYVLYVMNLRQTGDTTPHPWISYLLQMILSGMAIFIVGFAITRWIF